MKKKYLQRLLAAALTAIMVTGSLTGCGDNAAETNNAGSTADSSDAASDPASAGSDTGSAAGGENAAAGVEGWEAFAENVTLTIPVYDRGAAGVPDVTNNYWTKWIQENFGDPYNITVTFEPITRTDVLTSYNMLATVGELPTILMEYDFDKLAEWGDKGYLVEYDLDQFAQIAPTYYERMVELDQLKYTELNESRYFVLAERPYFNSTYTSLTWYRQDWLEELGYK
ncbi:MAG: sugar ABC transporter substrate-binding protein, partial [Acetatifactor sp.]|nr:sugar ABC transporter substrate-binding protein [Acetatifactor sp.]